ncbi:hypothetical protein RRG08_010648 [Elysia crispata]|uniref:Uncharacterized protein n=1 Tax=Elysia crispata TaxID=231223 RepID=A0AAE0Z153_9GAST|nr:hypothetical protein RRG08_010648 [Elysia crispata]
MLPRTCELPKVFSAHSTPDLYSPPYWFIFIANPEATLSLIVGITYCQSQKEDKTFRIRLQTIHQKIRFIYWARSYIYQTLSFLFQDDWILHQ